MQPSIEQSPVYRGRFAPSPTGDLHFGSLVAALGSCLDARSRGGQWLVRIEDLDPPREIKGAADRILSGLDAFGFQWDDAILYQSQRREAYLALIENLDRQGLVYACTCSRRGVANAGRPGLEGPVYPGTCRTRALPDRVGRSLRIRTHGTPITLNDRIQNPLAQRIESDIGDFVIRRNDGLVAYQLAVAADDAYQEITHVVRGADLLLSTPRQVHIQQQLGLTTPEYAHLPLVLDPRGRKLSKQDQALPVNPEAPLPALLRALDFLGQPLPPEPPQRVEEFWRWAIGNWDIQRVPCAAAPAGTAVVDQP